MGYFSDGPDGNDPNRPTDFHCTEETKRPAWEVAYLLWVERYNKPLNTQERIAFRRGFFAGVNHARK